MGCFLRVLGDDIMLMHFLCAAKKYALTVIRARASRKMLLLTAIVPDNHTYTIIYILLLRFPFKS